MSDRNRRTLLRGAMLAAGVALLALPSPAARLTDRLDAYETAIGGRDAALTGELDKARKKEKKFLGKTLATLAKDAPTLDKELKTALKVATAALKFDPEDAGLTDPLEEATDGYEADVEEVVAGLEEEVAALPEGKTRTAAEKKLLSTGTYLDEATGQTLMVSRLKALLKTVQKTKPVRKVLDKGTGGGGGGGGGGCAPGVRALQAGESITAPYSEGGSFTASSVLTGNGFDTLSVYYYSCGASLTEFFGFSWYDTVPEVGVPYGAGFGSLNGYSVSYASGAPGGLLQVDVAGSATITFTEVDVANGNYAGTFTYTGAVTVTEGSFRITGLQ